MELIKQAMRCLENNVKQCVLRLIEDLIKNQCHNGNVVGKEVADGVRELVHRLWLRNNDEERCELLRMLKSLDVSRTWATRAVHRTIHYLDELLARCDIDWESRTTRNSVIENIEGLLRERFGWSEVRMCEEMWRFIGVDVDEFRRHGIEPCSWLIGLEELGDLKRPYWFGLRASDLAIGKLNTETRLELNTTNAVDAVFFLKILSTVKAPSLIIKWWKKRAPAAKYVSETINLSYYVDLSADAWPWPEPSADELKRILDGFGDGELAEFVAGLIDGDGTVLYYYDHESKTEFVLVRIATCKACPKRANLDVLKEVIARRFGIVGTINQLETADALMFYNRNAVKLLRRIVKYMHHPIRRIRAELILALHDGKISRDELIKLYKQTEYVFGAPDVKRNNGLDALARAAPQTHTHGEMGLSTPPYRNWTFRFDSTSPCELPDPLRNKEYDIASPKPHIVIIFAIPTPTCGISRAVSILVNCVEVLSRMFNVAPVGIGSR